MARRKHTTTQTALLLTSDEVADLCGWSRAHVHKAIQLGELPCIRVGRSVRIPREWLENWVKEQVAAWEAARAKMLPREM